jgi:DNA-binding TFAR19-related protein (PDSD5 family)
MTNHPITPPPELVQHWFDSNTAYADDIRRAAQWGADRELEAIQKEIITQAWFVDPRHRLAQLRAARRPNPPSVKQQALTDLGNAYNANQIDDTTYENILRALEALPE